MPDDALAPLLAHEPARRVLALLTEGGHRAWIVGGAVRDALLGRPIGDIDVTTDARPERVIELAESAGLKALPTGLDHGTVTLLAGAPVEVTTLRRDVETFGRHATVAFGLDPAEDAARRDFTMNALYLAPDGTLLDPTGGLPDLRARRIRFVGDPSTRIREDYLRSLRYFRFHAWYGDPEEGLDPDALDAIARNLDGLDTLSRERVGHETLRLLAAPDPAPAVAAMRITGTLARILPGAGDGLLAPLVHIEGEARLPLDPLRRLAALGGEDPRDALRLSKQQTKRLERLQEGMASLVSPGRARLPPGRGRGPLHPRPPRRPVQRDHRPRGPAPRRGGHRPAFPPGRRRPRPPLRPRPRPAPEIPGARLDRLRLQPAPGRPPRPALRTAPKNRATPVSLRVRQVYIRRTTAPPSIVPARPLGGPFPFAPPCSASSRTSSIPSPRTRPSTRRRASSGPGSAATWARSAPSSGRPASPWPPSPPSSSGSSTTRASSSTP
ncbi:tRNA nucleotidyltransferase [Rubellimicrobium mesophilum DSM 19309]|uniref:tRNA nucleotidyltransferase n=1 Tax=Rubellimicrobium mesophilum DSM 19309 TaxID=442562 RepID=A0A017HNK6_9RHOB|nr:tRNA nucleotidyltransferase [Rubellimicrobium mesophilum DSM 19309]